jgi:hypothetical protein
MALGISTKSLNALTRVRAFVSLVATMSSPSRVANPPFADMVLATMGIVSDETAALFSCCASCSWFSRSISDGRIAATHRKRYRRAAGAQFPDPAISVRSATSRFAASQFSPGSPPAVRLVRISAANSLYARF